MKPHLRGGCVYAHMTIGLLGGSFNPAHEGHLAISLYALKHLKLDQIWWLVSPQNPLKKESATRSLTKRIERAETIGRHPRLQVTSLESKLKTIYTSDTLRSLKRHFPHVSFVWLMGADNLRQIPKWNKWQDIFQSVPVAVFRRPAYPAGHGLGKAAIRFARAWHAPRRAQMLSKFKAPAWIILDNKLNYTSSTSLRKEQPSW